MLKKNHFNSGFTAVESIVAISLVSLFTLIFGVSYSAISNSQYLKHKNLAYNLATEEIEALRNMDFTKLINCEDADFIGVIYNYGDWSVQPHGSAPSLPNAYALTAPAGLTGVAAVPGFEFEDFTYEAKIYIDSSSPSGWETGLYARYQDLNNYYLLSFDGTNINFKKKLGGAQTTLNSDAFTLTQNSWHTVKLVAAENAFEAYIDDVLELSATDAEEDFSDGRLALYGGNSVKAYFDDISVTDQSTISWNFDTDEAGQTPAAWQRFGINDLPNGQTRLTIADAETGYTDIKAVTARLEWDEKNSRRSVELKTLITR